MKFSLKLKLIAISMVIIVLVIGYFAAKSYPPDLIIKSSYETKEAEIGAYSWKTLWKSKSVDLISPSDNASYYEPIISARGDEVKLAFSNNPIRITIECIKGDTMERYELRKKILELPDKTGLYVYNVIVQYWQGRVTYWFKVEIK